MKNLSVAITVTCGTESLPAFQEHSLVVASEGAVSRRVYVWAPPLPHLGNNIQTSLRSLLLLF